MIVVHFKNNNQSYSTKCGRGEISSVSYIVQVHADGRELERILINAPFLRKEEFEEIGTWEDGEAIAAALAFNYNEK